MLIGILFCSLVIVGSSTAFCSGGSCSGNTGNTVSSGSSDCPADTYYDASRDACIRTVIEYNCPTGYHMDNDDSCVSNNNPSCPSGTKWDSIEQACIKTTIVCDEGFTYDPQQMACVPSGTGGCYPGSTWDSIEQACVADSCPSGTTWSDPDNACVAVIQGNCPQGYHDDGTGGCIPDTENGGCYPGSTWDPAENACVSIGGCPEGTTWSDADNACVHTSVQECPEDYVFDSAQNACVPINGPECPSGSVYYAPEQACISCEDGYKLDTVSGGCVPDCPLKGGSVQVTAQMACMTCGEGKVWDTNKNDCVDSPTATDKIQVCKYGGDVTGTGGVDIVQKYWDFGDGTFSNELSGTKIYNQPGTFTPKLVFIDQCGNEQSSTPESGPVTVETPCTVTGSVDMSASYQCVVDASGASKCDFTSNVKPNGDFKVNTTKWDFGCGCPTSSDPSTSHTYTEPGCYEPKFTITDQCGKEHTITPQGDPICVCEKGQIYDDSQKKCVSPPPTYTPTPKKTPIVIVIHITPIIKPVTLPPVIERQTRPPMITPTPKKFVVITKISTKVVKPGTQLTVVKKTPTIKPQTFKTPITTKTTPTANSGMGPETGTPTTKCDWSGVWNVDGKGDITFTQSGNQVKGTSSDGKITIDGTVSGDGNTFTGTMTEGANSGSSGNSGNPGGSGSCPSPPNGGSKEQQIAYWIFKYTNDARANAGLAPYCWSDELAPVATHYSGVLAASGSASSHDLDGPWQNRFNGISNQANGENIAFTITGINVINNPISTPPCTLYSGTRYIQDTPEAIAKDLVDSWMLRDGCANPPDGHKKNILSSDFNMIGIGVATGSITDSGGNSHPAYFATQDFIKATNTISSTPTTPSPGSTITQLTLKMSGTCCGFTGSLNGKKDNCGPVITPSKGQTSTPVTSPSPSPSASPSPTIISTPQTPIFTPPLTPALTLPPLTANPTHKKVKVITKVITKVVKGQPSLKVITQTLKGPIITPLTVKPGTQLTIMPKGTLLIKGKSPIITLSRGMCFGTCPVYNLSIFQDGTVTYEGKEYVKIKGTKTGKINSSELNNLVNLFRTDKYMDMNDQYVHVSMTDLSYVTTSFIDNGIKKTIYHYEGDDSAPKDLTTLEDAIDKAVNLKQWTNPYTPTKK